MILTICTAATPDFSGVKPSICVTRFRDFHHHSIPKASSAQTRYESCDLTSILEALEQVERCDRPTRVKAIEALAQETGITQAQIWHLRSLWIGGAA